MSLNMPEFALYQHIIKLRVTDALLNKQICEVLDATLLA